MKDEVVIYRARRIFQPDGPLLGDGAVVCREGRITAVEPWEEARGKRGKVEDLGDALLLPGLINVHTHLRLTHLKGKIAPTKNFVGWLAKIALRSKLARRTTLQRSIAAGARELLEGGCTTAVELDVDGLSTETLKDSPLRIIFAHECISLDPSRAETIASRMMKHIAQQSSAPLRRRHGLAPHAPYSVSRELWEELARRVGQTAGLPIFLTVHLSESSDEVEMFEQGRGKMVKWLKLFRALPRGWQPPSCSPVAFLEQTGILATPGIAAHCGCANDADAAILARHGWTVAFCPGTHEYFRRPPYPLERFRRAGVPVCVATDSAASNTGLGMMEEMRRLARMFPVLTADDIIAAATTIPARAIGWGDDSGRIAPGFCADFSAWSPCPNGSCLERAWFEGPLARCTATIIAGEIVRATARNAY